MKKKAKYLPKLGNGGPVTVDGKKYNYGSASYAQMYEDKFENGEVIWSEPDQEWVSIPKGINKAWEESFKEQRVGKAQDKVRKGRADFVKETGKVLPGNPYVEDSFVENAIEMTPTPFGRLLSLDDAGIAVKDVATGNKNGLLQNATDMLGVSPLKLSKVNTKMLDDFQNYFKSLKGKSNTGLDVLQNAAKTAPAVVNFGLPVGGFIQDEIDDSKMRDKKYKNGGSLGLGQAINTVSPLLSLIPGFGTMASMGLGLVGKALGNSDEAYNNAKENEMKIKSNTPTGTLGLPNYNYGGRLSKMKFGGKMNYQNGGSMLKEYDGPSHANGGIPVDHKGAVTNSYNAAAEVEGGETSRKGYVFSDKLTDPVTGKTFAEMSKSLNKKYQPKGYDILRDKTKELEFKQLEKRNDNVRTVVENTQQQIQQDQQSRLMSLLGQQMEMGGLIMANGGMIKRADGSYSQRGLWDNIRANAGSGKKPTQAMLDAEDKINKMAMGGSINIDPSKKGTFTAAATKHNMGVQEFANKVLSAEEGTYSPEMRMKANFAKNASKWNHENGGYLPKYVGGGGLPLPDPKIGLDQFYNIYGNVFNPTPTYPNIYYGKSGTDWYTFDKSKPDAGWTVSSNKGGIDYLNNTWTKNEKNKYTPPPAPESKSVSDIELVMLQNAEPPYDPVKAEREYKDRLATEAIRESLKPKVPETAGPQNYQYQFAPNMNDASILGKSGTKGLQTLNVLNTTAQSQNPQAIAANLMRNIVFGPDNLDKALSPYTPETKKTNKLGQALNSAGDAITGLFDANGNPIPGTEGDKTKTNTGKEKMPLTMGDKLQMASNFISPAFNLISSMQGYDKEPEMGNKYEREALDRMANLRIRPDYNPIIAQANATREAINEGSSGVQRLASLLGVNNQVANVLASNTTQVANQNVALDQQLSQAQLMQGERDRMEKIRAKGITDANQAAQFGFLSKAFEQLGPAVGTIGSGTNNRAEMMTMYNMMKNIYPDFSLVPFSEFIDMMGASNFKYTGGVKNLTSGNVSAFGAGSPTTTTTTNPSNFAGSINYGK